MTRESKAIGAMLGAAYGDALGWPNESAMRTQSVSTPDSNKTRLVAWKYKAGGRYYPHIQEIPAGTYSDDTQLILCVSRALLRGNAWWNYLTQVELPFWTAYERGGGGATKRAAASWLSGTPPWSPKRDSGEVHRYFNAGGNGAAMRILPHIIHRSESNFSSIADRILMDAVTTHGHPRAILAALAYGYALWVAYRKDSELAFGELIASLLQNEHAWSAIPDCPSADFSEWRGQCEKVYPEFHKGWESAKQETLANLRSAENALKMGVLVSDASTLERLACFDKKVSGAGTVAAVACIYLASRHAASPSTGVVTGAFARGADTDTIASMTGGLLGCIHGSEWLGRERNGIQDYKLIEKTAIRLVTGCVESFSSEMSVSKTRIEKWEADLGRLNDSAETLLPDGRRAVVRVMPAIQGKSFTVSTRRLLADDGQSFEWSKITKAVSELAKPMNGQDFVQNSSIPTAQNMQVSFTLPVASIPASRAFYQGVLGLKVKNEKANDDRVVFEEGLVLEKREKMADLPSNRAFCAFPNVRISDIESCYSRIGETSEGRILTQPHPVSKDKKRYCFVVEDPDKNIVHIYSDGSHVPSWYSEGPPSPGLSIIAQEMLREYSAEHPAKVKNDSTNLFAQIKSKLEINKTLTKKEMNTVLGGYLKSLEDEGHVSYEKGKGYSLPFSNSVTRN